MNNTLAVDGGKPFVEIDVPKWPVFDNTEREQLNDVLESGQWGSLTGTKVHEFEKQFAEFQQAKYGICVPNGTLALEMALKALGIGPGDEVITTPYTFIATASAVINTGAIPVFIDIDPDTYLMDLNLLEGALSDKTKAVIPVHLGGWPVDMDELNLFAKKHSLAIVEDACQAWGSEWNGTKVGALGDLGAFSFQSNKNITAGEGGIVVTNNEELADICWSLHNVGRIRGGLWYQHERIASNLRMTEWQGAILLAQLGRYSEMQDIRMRNSALLHKALSTGIKGLTPLSADPRITTDSRHLFIVKYDPESFGGHTRDEFLQAFIAEGAVTASPGYIPLHQTSAIRKTLSANGYDIGDMCLPAVEEAGKSTIWLAQNEMLGSKDRIEMLAGAVMKIQKVWT